jgi:ABC-2 type transport system permease protein
MFGLFNLIGPHGNINNMYSKFLYPMIIGLALFLGAVLQCSLIGLASISMEGKPFWILKSLPVSASTVLKGKSLSIFILALPTVILIPIPLTILDGFPFLIGLFFIIEAFALVIAFTGIGIWSGSKMPNFDETMRNMPDLMSQFSITFISGFATIFLLGIPSALLTVNHTAGVVSSALACGWALVLFIVCLDIGKRAYDNIGSDLYM